MTAYQVSSEIYGGFFYQGITLKWSTKIESGQGFKWSKCPAVWTFHRISTETFFQTFWWYILFDVSLENWSDAKLGLFARWQDYRACAYYTEIGMCLKLKKFTFSSAVGDTCIYRIAAKNFFWTKWEDTMFVWNSLAILKKYYGFVVDEFSKLVHTIKSPGSVYLTAARHGLKETKCLAVRQT